MHSFALCIVAAYLILVSNTVQQLSLGPFFVGRFGPIKHIDLTRIWGQHHQNVLRSPERFFGPQPTSPLRKQRTMVGVIRWRWRIRISVHSSNFGEKNSWIRITGEAYGRTHPFPKSWMICLVLLNRVFCGDSEQLILVFAANVTFNIVGYWLLHYL